MKTIAVLSIVFVAALAWPATGNASPSLPPIEGTHTGSLVKRSGLPGHIHRPFDTTGYGFARLDPRLDHDAALHRHGLHEQLLHP